MKKSVSSGAFVLILSGIVCKFFGALFRLPLTNIVGIEGIGVFQMIMSIYSLLLVLVTSGVSVSLSKFISSARAKGQIRNIKTYLTSAIIYGISLGFVLSFFVFIFSKQISSLQGVGEGYVCYWLFIVLIPLSSLIGVFRGYFQGFENMTPTALSQIFEQIFKFVFGLFFAYIFSKQGVWQGVFGAFLGIAISEIVAFLFLLIVFYKKHYIEKSEGRRFSFEFLQAVLPLTFSNSILPFTHAFDSLVIVSRLVLAGFSIEKATALFGLQTGVVGAILNFPLIISFSVATSILPNVSYWAGKKNISKEKENISKAFGLMWYMLIPLVFSIMSVSGLLYSVVYPNIIENYIGIAKELSFWGGISIILTALMQFFVSILQAKGHFKYYLIVMVLAGVVKVVSVYFLATIPEVGIISIPLSNIFLSSIVIIFALFKLLKVVKFSYFEVLTPLLSGVVMFLSLNIFLSFSKLPNLLNLLLAGILGAVIYFVLTIPCIKKYISFIKNFIKRHKNV